MRLLRFVVLMILAAGAAGCASSGTNPNRGRGSAGSEPASADEMYARRFALEGFETRLESTKSYHDQGNGFLYRTTRDSLLTDVNSYIRVNPHMEEDPSFVGFLNRMSALDSLSDDPLDAEYLSEDDSLALSFADWPALDIALDPGLFSEYNTVFPLIESNRIDFWVQYFTGPGRERFERSLYRMQMHRPAVEAVLEELHMPRELICLALIESGFATKAVSSAKAVGPWQFMHGTAKLYRLRVNWWYDERRDIVASTYAACHYLKDLHEIWEDWPLAFAAYNCGEYRVARQIARQKSENFWQLDLPRQTELYVPKFFATLYILRDPAKYGFQVPVVDPYQFDLVTVTEATDLKVVARCAQTDVEVIRSLNPQCLRGTTPPGMEVLIKVPIGQGELCAEALEAIPAGERISWSHHKVRSGETLSRIASKYGTSIAAVKQLNNLGSSHMIRAGSVLLVPVKGAQPVATSASKPQYMTANRTINKQALENYARKAAPPSGYRKLTYTVRPNDTLGGIAETHRTSAKKIRSWNNLDYKKYIYPGQKLAIYVPESLTLRHSGTISAIELPTDECCKREVHTVRGGESLYSISRKYGVTVRELVAWNNRAREATLHPGDHLNVWKPRDAN